MGPRGRVWEVQNRDQCSGSVFTVKFCFPQPSALGPTDLLRVLFLPETWGFMLGNSFAIAAFCPLPHAAQRLLSTSMSSHDRGSVSPSVTNLVSVVLAVGSVPGDPALPPAAAIQGCLACV